MRFEEASGEWQAGRLRQVEATQLPGYASGPSRRYVDHYEGEGLQGPIDKRLEQVSHRRGPANEVMALVEHYRRQTGGLER